MVRLKLLVHSARQIVQVVDNGQHILKGKDMSKIAILQQGDGGEGLSLAVDLDGQICAIGRDSEVKKKFGNDVQYENTIDAKNKCILPGLVDGHTHSVWTGDRVHEFAMKLAGATYMEVHAAGGGIHFTVDHVRRSSEDELYADFKAYLERMLRAGTTLVECKSGYGLDADNEIKMLKVIERGRRDPDLPIDISATYCGAHAVPKGSSAAEATKDVLNVQLPRIRALQDSGKLHVDNIDVFCEKGVFDVEQTRQILQAGKDMGLAVNFHGEEIHRLNSAEAGKDMGLAVNFHGEEIHRLNSAEMGAELGSRAISHLEEVSEEGMVAMAAADTVATVLPTTAYILRLTPPPVRRMIELGVPVALGSDFNPNAHCTSMPIVMHLACVLMCMSMPEALVAATINAAASLGRSQTQGSLEEGKLADMVVLDAPRWEHLIYQFGSYHHLISHVIKSGTVVYIL